MKPRSFFLLTGILLGALLLSACATGGARPATSSPAVEERAPGLPNPASVYCEEQGGRVEIRTADDGSQAGVCLFADGSECEEWAFYRKECGPGTKPAAPASGQKAIEPQVDELVVEAARQVLAEQLNLDAEEITVETVEARLWKDSCLDLGTAAERCTTAITPGFLVVLKAGDLTYTFHTNETASAVRQEK